MKCYKKILALNKWLGHEDVAGPIILSTTALYLAAFFVGLIMKITWIWTFLWAWPVLGGISYFFIDVLIVLIWKRSICQELRRMYQTFDKDEKGGFFIVLLILGGAGGIITLYSFFRFIYVGVENHQDKNQARKKKINEYFRHQRI